MAKKNNRYALGFLCNDGHTSIIAGSIYDNYNEVEQAQKKAQLNHKHRIDIVSI